MATEKYLLGTKDTVLNTGSSLANNSLSLSSAYTPTTPDYVFWRVIFNGTFGGNPGTSTGLTVWFIGQDGSGNYEDGDGSTTPAKNPSCVIPVRSVNTAQVIYRDVIAPAGTVKVLLKNDGTGQTLNSGWTLSILPFTRQIS